MNKLRFYTLIKKVHWEEVAIVAFGTFVFCVIACVVFGLASEWKAFLEYFSAFFATIGLTTLIFFPIPLALKLLEDYRFYNNWLDAKIEKYTGSPRPDDAFPYKFELYELPSSEGGGYVVMLPGLNGCVSDGDTPNEAVENGKDAAIGLLEMLKDYDREIPKPDNHLG